MDTPAHGSENRLMPLPPRPVSLAAKLGALGAALMALALGSIALTLWVTWQLEGGAAAVNEAGRLRMQGWRMAQSVSAGDLPRAERLAVQFDESIALLRAGDPARPLFVPADAATSSAFRAVQQNWTTLRADWLRPGAHAIGEVAEQAEALVHDVDRFVGGIEARLSRWTALLTLFQLLLMGLAIAAGNTPLAIRRIFEALWTTGADPADERKFAELARSLDVDPLCLDEQAIKDALRMETAQAVARGVFGVPTLFVDGELFWGADAMDFVEAYLADPGIVATEEMQRVINLPVGASRRRD